jgi:hypothetical protein
MARLCAPGCCCCVACFVRNSDKEAWRMEECMEEKGYEMERLDRWQMTALGSAMTIARHSSSTGHGYNHDRVLSDSAGHHLGQEGMKGRLVSSRGLACSLWEPDKAMSPSTLLSSCCVSLGHESQTSISSTKQLRHTRRHTPF